jgi:hypothetical protein
MPSERRGSEGRRQAFAADTFVPPRDNAGVIVDPKNKSYLPSLDEIAAALRKLPAPTGPRWQGVAIAPAPDPAPGDAAPMRKTAYPSFVAEAIQAAGPDGAVQWIWCVRWLPPFYVKPAPAALAGG